MALNSVSYKSQVSRSVYSTHRKVTACAEPLKLHQKEGQITQEDYPPEKRYPEKLLIDMDKFNQKKFSGNIGNSPWGLVEKKKKVSNEEILGLSQHSPRWQKTWPSSILLYLQTDKGTAVSWACVVASNCWFVLAESYFGLYGIIFILFFFLKMSSVLQWKFSQWKLVSTPIAKWTQMFAVSM